MRESIVAPGTTWYVTGKANVRGLFGEPGGYGTWVSIITMPIGIPAAYVPDVTVYNMTAPLFAGGKG
jgi:hypothetical protein